MTKTNFAHFPKKWFEYSHNTILYSYYVLSVLVPYIRVPITAVIGTLTITTRLNIEYCNRTVVVS